MFISKKNASYLLEDDLCSDSYVSFDENRANKSYSNRGRN